MEEKPVKENKEIKGIKNKKISKDSRSVLREKIFNIFFADEMNFVTDEILEYILEDKNIKSEVKMSKVKEYLNEKHSKNPELEEYISKYITDKWDRNRISNVNIAILKLAIIEIKYFNLPYKIAINEAINLAKAYGDEKSGSFINGFLANFIKENIEE